jgi:hypothetical protein
VARASNPGGTTATWVRDRLDGPWSDEDFVGWSQAKVRTATAASASYSPPTLRGNVSGRVNFTLPETSRGITLPHLCRLTGAGRPKKSGGPVSECHLEVPRSRVLAWVEGGVLGPVGVVSGPGAGGLLLVPHHAEGVTMDVLPADYQRIPRAVEGKGSRR